MTRICFLSHFILCLACAALAFFAWQTGAVLMVWQSDSSMMTSVIACLFVGTAVWLGWQAWRVDTYAANHNFLTKPPSTEWGHHAALMSPALGMLGTTIGLSMQGKALMSGTASFGALSTALFTTACGMIGFVLIATMTFCLDESVKRARR